MLVIILLRTIIFSNIFFKRYIEIIFFLFFNIDFLYHHIKIILKYQKILIWIKEKKFKAFLKRKNKHAWIKKFNTTSNEKNNHHPTFV
jgi:hypothetical protein